mgnify:CR=1 FL=1
MVSDSPDQLNPFAPVAGPTSAAMDDNPVVSPRSFQHGVDGVLHAAPLADAPPRAGHEPSRAEFSPSRPLARLKRAELGSARWLNEPVFGGSARFASGSVQLEQLACALLMCVQACACGRRGGGRLARHHRRDERRHRCRERAIQCRARRGRRRHPARQGGRHLHSIQSSRSIHPSIHPSSLNPSMHPSRACAAMQGACVSSAVRAPVQRSARD